MPITMMHVDCLDRSKAPSPDETIDDDLHLNELCKAGVYRYDVYLRDKESCPWGRGSWMIDLWRDEDIVMSVKLPIEMNQEEVDRYCAPLALIFEKQELIIPILVAKGN